MDNENNAAAMLAAIDQAIEASLAPAKADAVVEVDPEFAAFFKHLVALTCDAFPAMTQQQICEAFMHLAADGRDRQLVERPVNVRFDLPQSAPEPLYGFDSRLRHRVAVLTPPVAEPDAPHLNTNL